MSAHFGLDIGTHSIKMVELNLDGSRASLVSAGFASTPTKALKSESPEDFNALAESIKKLHKDTQITNNRVVASLPESQIFTRFIDLPKVSEKEIANSIKYEAEQYIPISISDVRLDYQVITQSETKIEVLIVAAPNLLIEKFMKVLQMADLTPIALETEILATSRAVFHSGHNETTLCISLGHQTTDICIVDSGVVIFTRSISTGGATLARAVAQSLGFQLDQAEQYKQTYGLDETQMEGKVVAAIKPVFDIVIDEIRRAIAFFSTRHPDKAVKKVILAGGTAKLAGLTDYLTNTLGLQATVFNPWVNIGISSNIKVLSQGATQPVADYLNAESPTYAVAVGLALRTQGT